MAFLSFKWLFSSLLSVLHPFYISVTEINHNAKEKSVEISCKIFAEDLQDILKKNSNRTIDLSAERNKTENDKLVADYVKQHLSVSLEGKATNLVYLGFEKDKEAIYCYFEINNISSVKKLDVTNSILHDFTDKQINIVHATVNGHRKSTKLDYPENKVGFSY